MRRLFRLVMALLRELADENAYQRHLDGAWANAFRRGVAALQRGAAAREICAGEVLLRPHQYPPNGGLVLYRVGVPALDNRTDVFS